MQTRNSSTEFQRWGQCQIDINTWIVADGLLTLKNCKDNITKQCNISKLDPYIVFVNPNISLCGEYATTFRTKYDRCKNENFNPDISAKCSCFVNITNEYNVFVKPCLDRTNAAFKNVNKEKNICTASFKVCKDNIPVVLNATKTCEVPASSVTATASPKARTRRDFWRYWLS